MSIIKTTYPSASAGTEGSSKYDLTPWATSSGEVWTVETNAIKWASGAGGSNWRTAYPPAAQNNTCNLIASMSFNTTGSDNAVGFSDGDIMGATICRWYRATTGTAQVQTSDSGNPYISGAGVAGIHTLFSITYDGTNWKYYIDGVLKATVASALSGRSKLGCAHYPGTAGGGYHNIYYGLLTGSIGGGSTIPSASISVTAGSETSIIMG